MWTGRVGLCGKVLSFSFRSCCNSKTCLLPLLLAVEVVEPGLLTTVQDYPGRVAMWSVGVPPSGEQQSLLLLGRLLAAAGTYARYLAQLPESVTLTASSCRK